MALSPGARVGSYEIVGPLGAGGMGEVYRARDSRLGRDAAIKILPDVFLNDADRVARFEREARTLASLNHPNIAQAVRVIEDAAFKQNSGAVDVDVSDAGTLTYIAGASFTVKSLAWVDQHGAETPMSAPQRGYQDFKLSPEGTRAVVALNDDGSSSLYVYDLTRGSLTRITPPGDFGQRPLWSGDSRFVYFSGSSGAERRGLFRVAATGGGSPELVLATKAGDTLWPTAVTSDGRSLVISSTVNGTFSIQLLNVEGAPSLKPLIPDTDSLYGRLSPDGRWIAYAVRSGLSSEVFTRPFPNVNGDRVQVSTSGGSEPVWAWNSRAIFYTHTGPDAGVNGIWRVDLVGDGKLGRPVLVLPADASIAQTTDIATGGDRFVRIQPVIDKGKTNELRIVLNWFDVLKQKMAGGK